MNKDGHLYSIIFTFVLTALFTAVLAITQAVYLPAITANEVDVHRRAILKVLNVSDESFFQDFAVHVSQQSLGESAVYIIYNSDGTPQSYAFPMNGQGLWGAIKGYIGVSGDFGELLGLEFVEQNETPGLGGRIDEDWFKAQFSGIKITPGQPIGYGDGLDAVTGATSSSNAVLRLLNETLTEVFALQEVFSR